MGLQHHKIHRRDKAPYMVNADNWKKAFDLSNINYFTFHGTQIEDDETTTIYGKYENGTFEGTRSNREGDNYESEDFSVEMKINDFEPLGLGEFIRELEDFDDYGYSLFKFSDKTLNYEAVMEVDIPNVKVNVSFEYGKIVSITLKGESTDPGFSDINIEITMNYQR